MATDDDPGWSGLNSICGFNSSAPTFLARFIRNAETGGLTPCIELLITATDHFVLLFFSVLAFWTVKKSSRIPSAWVRRIVSAKLLVAAATCVLFGISIMLGALSGKTFRIGSICAAEYAMGALVWAVYGSVWAVSLRYNAWTRPKGLCVSYCVASASFVLISVQRWLSFGLSDPRTLISVSILFVHLINYHLCVVEFVISRRQGVEQSRLQEILSGDGERVRLPEAGDEGAGWLSQLLFCWTNPLVLKGYRRQLERVEDVLELPPSLKVVRVERQFLEAAPSPYTDAEPFSFTKTLLKAFGAHYFSLALLRLIGDSLKFTGPILLHLLINCLQDRESLNAGYRYASMMLVASFLSALCDFAFNWQVNKVALKVRCATLLAVYDKLLQVPLCRLASRFSSGQLINFMSTDVDRVVGACTSFHSFWSMPMNLAIALYLLYREVGLAFLSGLLAAVLLVPLNKCIATKIGEMSRLMLTFKDQRMKLLTEVIRAVRVVKLNNWEPYFERRIDAIRQRELHYLKARKYLDALCVYLWASAPLLITLAILITYTWLMGEQLTAAKVFTSLALVQILIVPLNAFPWVLNSLVEAWVSKQRFDSFFALPSMERFATYSLVRGGGNLLELERAGFSWHEEEEEETSYGEVDGGDDVGGVENFSIRGLTLEGRRGMVIGVVGPVGAGKSTLLMGILGETHMAAGSSIRIRQQTIHEGFAYVGQECWLRRGTIRDNILCDTPYQSEHYQRVLHATAIDYDLRQMPNGDQWAIGDDGTTLSGGQRARLALARALYQDNAVYLLDDPFASLDQNVAKHVWTNCVEGMLKGGGKLVLLVTHNWELLRGADWVLRLNGDGSVAESGLPNHVLKGAETSTDSTAPPVLLSSTNATSANTDSEPFDASYSQGETSAPDTNEEEKQAGTVQIRVYRTYLLAIGRALSASILLALLLMQVSKNASDVWLSEWTSENLNSSRSLQLDWSYPFGARQTLTLANDEEERGRSTFFLTVYICVAAANTIFTLLRAFLFAYGGVVAARRLHVSLLDKVLHSTIAWWDSTPRGRVVNRLCSDVYQVDDSLPFQLNICLAALFNLFGSLLITAVALPFLIPLMIALLVVYYFIQRYYRYTTCELKRLQSLTLSPLYSHITDSVLGLVTIRAQRFAERFTGTLRHLLENNLRVQYSSLAASQWLSVRLQLLGVVMVSAIAFTGLLETRLLAMHAGMIALAITYALAMTNQLNSLLCSFIDTEKELVSAERIADYVDSIPQEDTSEQAEQLDRLLYCRTISGQIDFTGVSLRYSPHQPWALKNVTFRVEAGQRVGIIGKTGAGKSSLFQALLRAHPVEAGKIYIDGTVDLSQLDPRAVRSIFGYVAQQPFLFSGTLRENLCGVHSEEHSDAELIDLLTKAGLAPAWLQRYGGLDGEVREGGSNYSFGERQILGLCRLILARPRVVVIDEATAHMDETTHVLMNRLLTQLLPNVTVLAIAHRTLGLEQFDWILELSNGTIHRQGKPHLFQHSAEREGIGDGIRREEA